MRWWGCSFSPWGEPSPGGRTSKQHHAHILRTLGVMPSHTPVTLGKHVLSLSRPAAGPSCLEPSGPR